MRLLFFHDPVQFIYQTKGNLQRWFSVKRLDPVAVTRPEQEGWRKRKGYLDEVGVVGVVIQIECKTLSNLSDLLPSVEDFDLPISQLVSDMKGLDTYLL